MRSARLLSGIIAVLLALLGPSLAVAQDGSNLHGPLCPAWIEGLLFDSYRNLASQQGRPQKSWPGVAFEEQTFSAQDGTEIYGYRAFADAEEPERQPALVIVPGNAMLADQLYPFAAYFALHGFTAYIFDYRGYGGSGGVPQSHALVKDFREVLALVAGKDHPELSVYALSSAA